MKSLQQKYQIVLVNGVQCSIGLGAYGSVQLAKCLESNQTVALKKVNNQLGITEVRFHQSLNHQNIIKLIDYFYDEQNKQMYIILEYAENGCLYDFIKKDGIDDKNMIRTIFKSTCNALDYMHRNGIMHRDVKPQNILLGKNNIIKLCDFGFAAYCEPRKTICGTPQYMAPQMILGKQYNHKVDIWGLGILLFQLIEGHAPFEGNSKEIIIRQMKKPIYFSEKFTPSQIDLIHKILRVRYHQRLQIKQIFQHGWFKNQIKLHQQLSNNRSIAKSTPKQSKNIKIIQIKQIGIFKQHNANSHQYINTKQFHKKYDQILSNQKSRFYHQKLQILKNGKISLKKKLSENQFLGY